MSCKPMFLISDHCENIVEVISCKCDEKFECCGEVLKELVPNTSDGATEKHLPVVERQGNEVTVKVGSIYHPMSEEHSIAWVYLETKKGGQRINLCPTDQPVAEFVVAKGDEPIAAYAYCNLHGFWKTEI